MANLWNRRSIMNAITDKCYLEALLHNRQQN